MKIDNENQNKTVENPENGNKKGHSLVSKGFTLSLLTLASRVLGLIREMTKAKFLGTGHLGDAFGIAFQIPNFFRRLLLEDLSCLRDVGIDGLFRIPPCRSRDGREYRHGQG